MTKFNLNKINIDFFNAELKNLDDYLDVPEEEDLILEKCKMFSVIDYPIKLYKIKDNASSPYWLAEHPDLPGCKAHGNSKEEAISNLEEVKSGWIYTKLCDNEDIPEPEAVEDIGKYSGRILLRLPKELHHKLAQKAKFNNISLNQEILFLISYALGECDLQDRLLRDELKGIKDLIIGNTKQNEVSFNRVIDRVSKEIMKELDISESFLEDSGLSYKEAVLKANKIKISYNLSGLLEEDYILENHMN